MRTRTATAVLAALLTMSAPVLPAGAGTPVAATARAATTAPGGPTAATGTAAEARRQAAAAAREVAEATARYVDLAADLERATSALAGAAVAATRAEVDRDDAARRLAGASARRATGLRDLYLQGSLGFGATVLAAGSPDEAMDRISSAARMRALVMARATGAVGVAARDVRDATQAQERGRAADEELARAVADLRGRAAATDAGLAAARAGLQRLRALATRLQRDEDAARRREEAARALAAAEAAAAAAARARRRTAGAASAVGMPPGYEDAYRSAAATCPGMSWTLLAAVGQVESGHGRNPGPSSAGAEGPMQFMPATFAAYGVDGDGDGTADPWDIRDAAPSAAHYLCRSGGGDGPDGVRRALFAYNHAQWYVDLVLDAQRAVEAAAVTG